MITEDEIWLEEMSKGDTVSFTNIYERYWRDLFIGANKVLRDQSIAEDIIQDTFTNLWDNRKKAYEIKSLNSYLKVSVRNACIKHIERYINRYNFVELLPDILDKVLTESTPLNKLYLQDVEDCIEKSIEKMPPKMKQVFHLSRSEHKSRTEIAIELGISPETVKKHIQHALVIIKNNLTKLDSYKKAIVIFYFLLYQ